MGRPGTVKPGVAEAIREEYAARALPPGKTRWRKPWRRLVPSQHTLARKYGLSQGMVWRIINRGQMPP